MEISYKVETDIISLRIKSPITKLGTFHKIVTILYHLDLDILSADIQTHESGESGYIDDFFSIQRSKGLSLPDLQKNLALLLDSALSKEESIAEWSKRYSIPEPDVQTFFEDKPEFIFVDDPETKTTCFYMEAFPKKGLLYHISRIFVEKGLDLVKAKVETDLFSKRAKDSFYLRNQDGNQFGNSELASNLVESILHYKGQKTYSAWT